MVTGNSKIEKINTITEDPDSIMLVVNQKKIKFIHSCKKFVGIPTNPITTVVGLIGQRARAFPIVIDSEKATSSKEVTLLSDARIWACEDATKMKEFDNNATPPPVATGARTRSRGDVTAKDTTPPQSGGDGCGRVRHSKIQGTASLCSSVHPKDYCL
jgi:hypothetical protein